jgi:type 1 glutamine amidotransferase
LDKVRWVDESYWALAGDPKQIKLMATSTEEGKPQPLFWTVERGRGRVFVSIPGHYAWTLDDPVYRTVLLRGIAWAGHRDVDRFNKLVTLDARVQ